MVPSRSLRLPGDAANGGNGHTDPTRVATDFFAALALQDWDAAVGMVEPRSLVDFRDSQLTLFASWAEQRGIVHHDDVTLRAFAGAPTLRELAGLSAEVFAARYLAAGSGAPSAYRVLGHVLESEDVAHVVYRPIHQEASADALDVAVVHLRRHDGHWCVLMSQELADDAFILFDLDDLEDSAQGGP